MVKNQIKIKENQNQTLFNIFTKIYNFLEINLFVA